MCDYHRGIAVVRVQDLQARSRGPDPLEQLVDRRYVDLRRGGGSQADRLVAEEVRLPSEPEVHRAELRETTDLPEDAGHRSELRLAIHRLDAERTALVDVPYAAFRRVEFDRQRFREVGMGSDHVGTEEGPAVPLLHRSITVGPFSGRQVVVDRGIDVAQRDPIERLDERLVVIAESRERSPEHSRTFEGARMMDDLSFANRQAAQILARHDGAREQDKEVATQRVACPDLADGNVLPRVVRVTDRARHLSRVRRDVRRHAEVGWLVDVAIEDHDLHGPESMLPSR